MSASEKLKALDVRVRQMPQTTIESMDYAEAKNAVADALPQIVAVVEAAEYAREVEDYILSAYEPDGTDLQRALAALDEALS